MAPQATIGRHVIVPTHTGPAPAVITKVTSKDDADQARVNLTVLPDGAPVYTLADVPLYDSRGALDEDITEHHKALKATPHPARTEGGAWEPDDVFQWVKAAHWPDTDEPKSARKTTPKE